MCDCLQHIGIVTSDYSLGQSCVYFAYVLGQNLPKVAYRLGNVSKQIHGVMNILEKAYLLSLDDPVRQIDRILDNVDRIPQE